MKENWTITRRRALGLAGAGLALQAPFVMRGFAQEPLRMGMILAKQGVMSNQGADLALGVQTALKAAGNKIADRAVELNWLDEPTPQEAVQSYQRSVDQNAIVTLGGTLSSNTLAIGASAEIAKVPFIGLNSVAREPTGANCGAYLFRVPGTVPVYSNLMAEALLERGKRWYFIVASFVFGEDVKNSLSKIVQDAGGEVIGVDEVPLSTTDYSSYLLKVRQAKPDVLISGALNVGPILTQMNQMGMTGEIEVGGPGVSDTDLWSVPPQALAGVYGKPWFYANPDNPDDQKAFVENFIAENGKPPSDRVFQGWFATRLIINAIEKSGASTGPEVARALTEVSTMEGDFPVSFRAWDHQLIRPVIAVRARPPQGDDKLNVADVIKTAPTTPEEADSVFGSQADSLCKMTEL